MRALAAAVLALPLFLAPASAVKLPDPLKAGADDPAAKRLRQARRAVKALAKEVRASVMSSGLSAEERNAFSASLRAAERRLGVLETQAKGARLGAGKAPDAAAVDEAVEAAWAGVALADVLAEAARPELDAAAGLAAELLEPGAKASVERLRRRRSDVEQAARLWSAGKGEQARALLAAPDPIDLESAAKAALAARAARSSSAAAAADPNSLVLGAAAGGMQGSLTQPSVKRTPVREKAPAPEQGPRQKLAAARKAS